MKVTAPFSLSVNKPALPAPPTAYDVQTISQFTAATLTTSWGSWSFLGGANIALNGNPNDPLYQSGAAIKQLVRVNDDVYLRCVDAGKTFYMQPIRKVTLSPASTWHKWIPIADDDATHDPLVDIQNAPATYINKQTAPADLWELEMTDRASIEALCGYHIEDFRFGSNPLFGTFPNGIKYLEFGNDPALLGQSSWQDLGCNLAAWFMPLTPGAAGGAHQELEVYARIGIWLDTSVAVALQDVGMKLPGPTTETGFENSTPTTGGLVNHRVFHRPPIGGTHSLTGYFWDSTVPSGTYPPQNYFAGAVLMPRRLHFIDVGGRMNTFTGSTPNADAYSLVRLDGRTVHERQNFVMTSTPLTFWRSLHMCFYEGGDTSPLSVMRYRIAKLAMSTKPLGVPAEMFGSL